MNQDVLLVEKRGAVCWLTLNRPQALNAINRDLGRRLLQSLDDCAEDDDVRAIVIAGAGRAFCAGDDIRGAGQTTQRDDGPRRRNDLLDSIRKGTYWNIAQAMRFNPKPILARVHGFAYGAGLDLVMASDMAIAAEDAKLAAIFIQNAIIGGATQLPRSIPMKKAMEMLLIGDPVDGKAAEQMGLVNYAVPAEKLDETVSYWAGRLADGPTRVMAYLKFAAVRGMDMTLEQSVQLTAAMAGEGTRTEDREEGRRAFGEKRKPVYTGR